MTVADDRYRTLLEASCIADQPTAKAVLHSLRDVLSSTCSILGADLYILDSDGVSLHVLAADREADAPAIKAGTKISRIGAVAQVLEEQKPLFLPDVSQEMSRHPQLAPFAAQSVGRSSYAFPVSTSQQRYGILVVTKDRSLSLRMSNCCVLWLLTLRLLSSAPQQEIAQRHGKKLVSHEFSHFSVVGGNYDYFTGVVASTRE